jgi:mannose-6-phosphate isomerase-like protein (cupin superfamily)
MLEPGGKTMRVTRGFVVLTLLAVSLAGGEALAKASVSPKADLKWAEGGIPGVSTAALDGDMAKGPSHFFLRYKAGLATPVHHHTPDHYVTVVSGNLVLILDGKEQTLGPGSYFAFTGKAPHAARCQGSEDCVMSVDARGPWDVVPEK